MEFIDIQSLDDDEMGRLVSITLEEFGQGLNRTQFNEVMLALFEDIAGFETLSRKRSQQYLKLLWLKLPPSHSGKPVSQLT
jgi:hypothetical protein